MPSPLPPQSFQFAVFFFAYYGYVGIFTPFASLYFSHAGMRVEQIAILMSLMQVTRIFGPNFWGALADRSGKRVQVLRWTALAALLSFIGMFWAHSFIAFFILMVLINGFTSAHGPLSEAGLVAEMRGDLTWYGRLRLWGSVGFIVAVMLGGQILERFGIAQLPLLCCGMLLFVWLSSTRLRETVIHAGEQAAVSALSLLRKKEVIAFFSSTCLMVMAHSALYVFYSLYLEKLGYSKSVIGTMWSIGVVAEIVFFFYQAPIFRRLGTRKLMLASLGIAVLRFIMIANVDGGQLGLLVLLIAQILHAATFGVHHSSSVMQLQRWFGGQLQARGQALFTSISYGFGGTVGGVLMGVCWESGGAHAVFLAAAAMAALALIAAQLSFYWQDKADAKV